MTDRPPPPYPADTRAKGWRFELDLERVQQSDTWALAAPDVRPWLLMLWSTAWQQTPCGTLPSDERVIAARIGMTAPAWAKAREILLRGWVLHDDGRLYHATITERVLSMQATKDAERKRKADYRARMAASRTPPPTGSPPPSGGVPELSHGTDAGQTRTSTGCDATGTGTGTGEIQIPSSPSLAVPPPAGAREDPPPDDPPTRTAAGAVTLTLRRHGIANANPGHPRLLALLQAGATLDEFLAFASKAATTRDPFAYVLGCVEGERRRAAEVAAAVHHGPMPQKPEPAAPAWVVERKGRAAQFLGPLARKRPASAVDNVIDLEVPRARIGLG